MDRWEPEKIYKQVISEGQMSYKCVHQEKRKRKRKSAKLKAVRSESGKR